MEPGLALSGDGGGVAASTAAIFTNGAAQGGAAPRKQTRFSQNVIAITLH
jgi:hypothetical protein